MSLIYREQAIDSICINICGKSHNDCGFWKKNFEFCNACKFAFLVESTPSAEKIGRWLDIGKFTDVDGSYHEVWKCDCCGYISYDDSIFCPNCGVKMVNEDVDEIAE